MKPFLPFALLLAAAVAGRAADDGFVPLFNGHDLSNWVNVNCAPETWSVRDGVIHCTGFPTGALRTLRQYENFILEVEWRHLERGGNSGVFIWGSPIAAPGVPFLRGIEVQVLDHGYNASGKNEWYTTHGDVFPIHGATMQPFGRHNGQRSFPSEERSKGSPEWNYYRVVCTNGVLRLHVNGKEVSGGEECNYRRGYLALESEGAPVEFRNLRVQELRSSGVSDKLTAPLDAGWRPLFNGLDLRGWRTNAATAARWQVSGERLRLKAGPEDPRATLWTESTFGDCELILDYQPPKDQSAADAPAVYFGQVKLSLTPAEPGKYQRYRITKNRYLATVLRNELPIAAGGAAHGWRAPVKLGLSAPGMPGEFMNLYVRDLREGEKP